MSGLRNLAKGGWHPGGKDGKKESWRSDLKGVNQVAGWMGRGKDSNSGYDAQTHQSAPLSTLRDPASFAPPPKRNPNATASPDRAAPDHGALGSPVATYEERSNPGSQSRYNGQDQQQEEEEVKPPPAPYRVNTTGLSTTGLPLPPRRNTPAAAPLSPSSSSMAAAVRPPPPTTAGGPPRLPPRLPPRQNSRPDLHTPAPPPNYQESLKQPKVGDGLLNQGALDRLGQAGVQVPGLNVGGRPGQASPPAPSRSGVSTPTSNWNDIPDDMFGAGRSRNPSRSPKPQRPNAPTATGQLNELQSRFAKMTASSSSASDEPKTTEQGGTSWAQKQAALSTASKFRQDPSSVSLSDARSAASTARNFQQRHGEQVAAGLKAANSFQADREAAGPASPTKKAPPPPPPKKRIGLSGGISSPTTSEPEVAQPPPIPFSSKPR